VWIGLIFVFSAALAREYDAEYIPDRPWIMLVPLAASLVSSVGLWVVLWLAAWVAQRKPMPFFRNYVLFLGMFWMTAPLAWLYAIPVERFMGELDAARANYALLGLVATWRVVLMVRVAQVWTGRSLLASILLVLAFGGVVLFGALSLSPWPVIEMMAGSRTEIEELHIGIKGSVFCFMILGAPALFVFGVTYMGATVGRRRTRTSPPWMFKPSMALGAKKTLWALAAVSVLAWLPLLPFTQPPLKGKPSQFELEDEMRRRDRDTWEQRMLERDQEEEKLRKERIERANNQSDHGPTNDPE
jgi:hypothetical protein